MSNDFRVVPIAIEEFLPLFNLSDEQLRERSARWLIADANPGYPCRVSLADAEVGERVLAVPFTHHDVRSPYRASGPVFVREGAKPADLEINEVPLMLRHRLLSLRAYDSSGMMLAAKVVPGVELVDAIIEHFNDPRVNYQHIHNASPGCFNCAVRRA